MTDKNFVLTITDKVKSALLFDYSQKLDIVSKVLKDEGIILKEAYSLDCHVNIVFTTTNETIKLHGFGLHKEKECATLSTFNYSGDEENFMNACRDLANKFDLLYSLYTLLDSTDYNDVKKILPELKPFLKLSEEERNTKKEKVYNYWRKTYALCIELFGEQARA